MRRGGLLDLLVPRFVTEEFAMKQVGRSSLHDIVCLMAVVKPGERFDGVGTITSFRLFGLALFPKQIGRVRAWRNPHDHRRTA
jgi:hypothetical protein